MEKQRIILAMIEAGGGHKATALAIEEGIKRLYGNKYDTEVVDFATYVGAFRFDEEHKKMWTQMLMTPHITRLGYELQDSFGDLSRLYLQMWAQPFFKKAEAWLLANPGIVFIPTHWLNAAAASWVRRRHPESTFRFIYYLCEPLDASSCHVWPGADWYLVGSDSVRDTLIERAIDPARIRTVGYAVRPSFFDMQPNSDLSKELGLLPDRLSFIASGGASGVGTFEVVVRALAKSNLPINLIVICGKNQELAHQLKTLSEKMGTKRKINLIILGFVTNMNQLLSCVDVAIVKAGPASIFEAVFMKKPVICYEHVARHELRNREFVDSHHYGWNTNGVHDLVKRVEALIRNPQLLEQTRQALQVISMQNAALTIAEALPELTRRSLG